MNKDENLTKATAGQQIEVSILRRGEKVKTNVTVSETCDSSRGGQWYCVTHDIAFDNNFQKDSHISEGKHQLAWNCFTHGIEAP